MIKSLHHVRQYAANALQRAITLNILHGRRLIIILICCAAAGYFLPVNAQKRRADYHIKIISAAPPVKSMRGLSVVTDHIVWVSGTGGMVGKSTDGGQNWQWMRVSGCDSCDWRSIYAFNDKEALVLNAGAPAHLFRTTDGGASWQRVFYDDTPGIFFDALSFFNDREGMAIGDPLQGRFTVIRTHDGGRSWQHDAVAQRPVADSGEAVFAASGTCLVTLPGHQARFATGGMVARLFTSGKQWSARRVPLVQGAATTGIFSIAFLDNRHGIAVGGDYKNDREATGNCMLTQDGGLSWTIPHTPPAGFKSCVTYITSRLMVTTGTSGTDISYNGGKDWQNIGEGFHVAQRARKGSGVFLAGKNIGILIR